MTTQRKSVKNVAASIAIGAVVLALLLVAGVFVNGGLQGVLPSGSSQSQAGATHVVTDSAGRSVEVPENPQRIAAFDSFAGNVCVLVGAGQQLQGAPGGVLSNKMLQTLYPDLSGLSKLSGNSLNVEELMAQNVDVVFVRGSLYEAGDETSKLDTLGIPYVVIEYETVEQQIAAIETIGQVCGGQAEQKAQAVADYYRQTIDLVQTRAASIPESDRVSVYHSINDPLLTDGSTSLGADWIARCGIIDVSSDEASAGAQGDYNATIEQVYSWQPDAVVCNTVESVAAITSSDDWSGLPAVKAGNVYNLPVSTSRWGQRGDPETFLAMLWLSKTLYPAYYEDIDLQQTVTAYYRDVIGLELDDDLWRSILSGSGIRAQGNGGQGEK